MAKNRYIKWRPKGSGWCTEPVEEFVKALQFDDYHDTFGDDLFEFTIVEMTQEAYDALPEFDGF